MKKKVFVFFIAFFTLFNGILSVPLYAMDSTSLSDINRAAVHKTWTSSFVSLDQF